MDSVMKSLPMVALRGLTIMPEMVVHFDVSRERSITAVQQAMMEDQKIFLVAQKSIETEDPGQEDVYSIGTVATVRQVIKLPKKIVRVLVSGEQRGRLTGISEKEPYLKAEVELLEETDFGIEDEIQKEAMARNLREVLTEYADKSGKMSKEAVKELISEILNENDEKKAVLLKEKNSLEAGTLLQKRNEYRLQYCEDTSRIVMQLEREFDMIERKYNKLIEQKTVFAKRALARIHYILQEGVSEEDNIIKLINLLDRSGKKDEILVEMRDRIRFSSQFKNITDNSFAGRRDRGDGAFTPVMLDEEIDAKEQHMTDFVPKPLYTRNELQSFRRKNTVDGIFVATEETVQSVEDLEKLLFLWQEETEERLAEDTVSVDGEIRSEDGLTYSRLVIGQNK